eukprot:5582199-Amphidinium_carterae.1
MSATANEKDFTEKLDLTSDMIVSIRGQTHPVSRFMLGQTISCSLRGKPTDPPPGGPSAGGGRRTDMASMRGIVQAIMQISLHDKLWSEKDPSQQYTRNRKGIDILVFLPGTAEISLMASTIECLVKGGYMTAIKVYKINARIDQKTIAELNQRAQSWDWAHQTYASQVTWDLVDKGNRSEDKESLAFLFKPNSYPARRVLLSTEAVNAGITLPYVEWVISSMGVRRVYYDPRREIRINVLAAQTKASAIQEGGRCGRVFPGNHLLMTTQEEMSEQLQVDELPGIAVQKLDGLYLRLLRSFPRSLVEELPWMEPVTQKNLEVVYDKLITLQLLTPGM